MQVRFSLNGRSHVVEVDPTAPAQRYLGEQRKREAICGDRGCMRCLVLLGGRVVPACIVPAYRLSDAELIDFDGLEDDDLVRDIMRAFHKIGISRCESALPGLVLSAYQLLIENPLPTDTELEEQSLYLTSRCLSRDEFERAVRLAGRVYKRKQREQRR
jgi:aerobic-type carbon monoxide dehydrogenase small subunit (CoxS/CutS family)